jgi:hypothetical protein
MTNQTTAGRYRKPPVEIDAVQWDGTADGATRIIDWILASGATATYTCSNPDRCAEHDGDTPHSIAIRTLESTMRADLGDWIIRGVQDEFYPCKPDVFAVTYERADVSSAVVAPPTDQAALRDRIAEILRAHANLGGAPLEYALPFFDGATPSLPRISGWKPLDDVVDDLAAAVLPEPADRAAVLRDFLWRLEQSAGDAAAEKFLDDNPELRRMAAQS